MNDDTNQYEYVTIIVLDRNGNQSKQVVKRLVESNKVVSK